MTDKSETDILVSVYGRKAPTQPSSASAPPRLPESLRLPRPGARRRKIQADTIAGNVSLVPVCARFRGQATGRCGRSYRG